MNMYLLEEAMCEKCRSSHFLLKEGEVKSLRIGGGLKNFRTRERVTNLGGLLLLGGVGTPLHAMNTKINSCGKVIFSFLEDLKTTLNALL